MGREFMLWIVVGLPWIAAALVGLGGGPLVRVLGARAGSFARYLTLGASALSLLFVVQAISHLMAPDDPRALTHTPLAQLIGPVAIGPVESTLTLVGDRLSTSAALVVASVMVVARRFVDGPAGRRELGMGVDQQGRELVVALRRLALIGALEGAAMLVILAGDLGLAAIGWFMLGLGAAIAVAGPVEDERRSSASARVLASALLSDLGLVLAALTLAVAGIGLGHGQLWAPLTGDRLYAASSLGIPVAEVGAAMLAFAVFMRLASLAWAGNSVGEAVLDAVLLPAPAIYLLIRYQRLLAYAPSVLAISLVLGVVLALIGAASALLHPRRGQARRSSRSSEELGLAGTGLAWVGLVAMAVGVGAWRTVVLLIVAQALGRLNLRLALVVAGGRALPPYSAAIGRVATWIAAGIAPGLSFVAIAQTLAAVLARASLLAPWGSALAALAVLVVAFAHCGGVARIWYQSLRPEPAEEGASEDGLDFGPLAISTLASIVLGIVTLASWFDWMSAPIKWLILVLPIAGGHELAPLGIREEFRQGVDIARPWVAGGAALVALVGGFAWTWTRERFCRSEGDDALAGFTLGLESLLAWPRRGLAQLTLVLNGLAELAARGIGRGLFEAGPKIGLRLGRDVLAGLGPRLRRLGGARGIVLGPLLGLVLVLGWLYAQPDAASVLPADGYGFGGLRQRLLRAGGSERGEASQPGRGEASQPNPDAPSAAPQPGSDAPGVAPQLDPVQGPGASDGPRLEREGSP